MQNTNEWWKLPVESCLAELKTSAAGGLKEADVVSLLGKHGQNALVERGVKSPWAILWEQLTGVLVVILIVAGIVSAVMGEYADALVIGILVLLNAVLGLTQEYRAEKAMAALKRMSVPVVKVRRGGQVHEISSLELVPGDVVILEAGGTVPADCRLLEAVNLRVQEAALTGESEPVEKHTQPLTQDKTALGDRRNMAYMGTTVTFGRGLAVVVATGMSTELGSIATMLQAVHREPTPLQNKLEQLGKGLAIAAFALVAIIFIEGLIRGGTGLENIKVMFMTAICMAVAAVPEGLPAVVTIALALGAQRMLKRNALIRKLLAVETLGSVTVICSDKTGTLTENRMTVTVLDVAGTRFDVGGRSGAVRDGQPGLADRHPGISPLLVAGALCNDALLKSGSAGVAPWTVLGDPTEGALVMVAAVAGLLKDDLDRDFPRVLEEPFDSDRKRMTTVHRLGAESPPAWCRALGIEGVSSAAFLAFCKGAPESLMDVCSHVWAPDGTRPMTEVEKSRILTGNSELAQKGMRVLGVAFRTMDKPGDVGSLEQNLVFLGLVGMIDPPRQEVKDAVAKCRTAGIRPIMITGDNPLTAAEIARQLGIYTEGEILTGIDLEKMTVAQLREHAERVAVYARVSPEHKLKIVAALKENGHVVAMTGDGVNDAPALRKSDIGVAMGITGTDVAKEASDMVLRDDNFATIVAAVEEGRAIYDNIRKFVKYMLSTNSGELWVMIAAPFLGMPLPLLPIQILWMNLVTDGLPALALGVERPERDIMRRKPRRTTDNIFGDGMGYHILWVGLLMAVVSLGLGQFYSWTGRLNLSLASDTAYYRTMVFTVLAYLQMGHVLAIRSHRQSLFTMGVFTNKALIGAVALTVVLQLALIYVPILQRAFKTVSLSAVDLAVCIVLSTTVFWAVELEKLIKRRFFRG
ncbi:MAG: cation-translocating P-type ATPase [bacterium]